MKITDALKRFRESRGLSMKDVAQVLGVTAPGYSRYEKVESAISAESLLKLADHYDVSPEYLLGRIDTPKLEAPKPEVDPQAEQFYTMFQTMLNTAVNRTTAG